MRTGIILMLVLVFLAAMAPAQEPPNPPGERWALCIGINDYQRMGKLRFCRQDAEELAKVLVENAGFEQKRVRTMTDGTTAAQDRPTLGNLRSRIRQFTELPGPDDTVVIFFAGHGDTVGGKYSLMPIDADKTDEQTVIDLHWVRARLAGCKAANKLLILDTCRPGGVRGPVPEVFVDFARAANVLVLASCAEGQTSYEDEKAGHGVFSTHLISGFAGAADKDGDKVLTQAELFGYVESRVKDWCVDQGNTQTPQLFPESLDRAVELARVVRRATVTPPPSPPPPATTFGRKLAEAQKLLELLEADVPKD